MRLRMGDNGDAALSSELVLWGSEGEDGVGVSRGSGDGSRTEENEDGVML